MKEKHLPPEGHESTSLFDISFYLLYETIPFHFLQRAEQI
jgi:hypothetical protein